VIYSTGAGQLILKAIYSEAFKDPTDGQKFGTSRYTNEYPSGSLVPETARNIELSAGWEPSKALAVEGAVYQTRYSDVVAFGFVPTCTQFLGCLQYQNRDDLRIRGLQLTARYRRGDTELWGNYTHTEPFQIDPEDLFGNPVVDAAGRRVEELRIADIAADRWNLGVDRQWSDRWSTAQRLHYVGPRRTGPGTTQPGSPFRQMDPYTTADATLSYRGLLPNTTFQLIALNLFDTQYYDPGLQRLLTASRVLQAGRTIHLRIAHRWP
jgi:outer membrane receptor for ferrienterochelin and colicins